MEVTNKIKVSLKKMGRSRKRSMSRKQNDASSDILCEGYLLKTGGHGHMVKNRKKRYFILKGDFLYYYSTNPSESDSKKMSLLKGIIYLMGCKISELELQGERKSFILKHRNLKEYVLTSSRESNHSIEIWYRHLSASIQKASKSLLNDISEGSFVYKYKEGTCWKKRFLTLKGNILLYFTQRPIKDDEMKGLKGFIDLYDVLNVQILKSSDPLYKRKHSLLLRTKTVSYQFACANSQQVRTWYDLIYKQMKKFEYERQPDVKLDSTVSSLENHPFQPFYKILYALEISESEIWEGSPLVCSLLLHFSNIWIQTLDLSKPSYIDVYYPPSWKDQVEGDHGVIQVHPYDTFQTLLQRLLSHLKISDQEYQWTTWSGYEIPLHYKLLYYGIGTLLNGWKLKLVPRTGGGNPVETLAAPTVETHSAPAVENLAVPTVETPAVPTDMYPLLVLSSEKGFQSSGKRIWVRPEMKVSELTYRLSTLSSFQGYLINIDGIKLPNDYTLKSLGFGDRFIRWELVFTNDKKITKTINIANDLKYIWTMFDMSMSSIATKYLLLKIESEMNERMMLAKDTIGGLREKISDIESRNNVLDMENTLYRMNLEQREVELRKIEKENERLKKDIEENKKRIEEDNKSTIEEENKKRIEEDNKSTIEEDNKKRFEERNKPSSTLNTENNLIIEPMKTVNSEVDDDFDPIRDIEAILNPSEDLDSSLRNRSVSAVNESKDNHEYTNEMTIEDIKKRSMTVIGGSNITTSPRPGSWIRGSTEKLAIMDLNMMRNTKKSTDTMSTTNNSNNASNNTTSTSTDTTHTSTNTNTTHTSTSTNTTHTNTTNTIPSIKQTFELDKEDPLTSMEDNPLISSMHSNDPISIPNTFTKVNDDLIVDSSFEEKNIMINHSKSLEDDKLVSTSPNILDSPRSMNSDMECAFSLSCRGSIKSSYSSDDSSYNDDDFFRRLNHSIEALESLYAPNFVDDDDDSSHEEDLLSNVSFTTETPPSSMKILLQDTQFSTSMNDTPPSSVDTLSYVTYETPPPSLKDTPTSSPRSQSSIRLETPPSSSSPKSSPRSRGSKSQLKTSRKKNSSKMHLIVDPSQYSNTDYKKELDRMVQLEIIINEDNVIDMTIKSDNERIENVYIVYDNDEIME